MAVNRVIANGETKLDLSSDTVTADTLFAGVTAHNAAGEAIAGTADLSTKQDKITVSGILKGDGAGGVSAAVANSDYISPANLTVRLNRSTAVNASDTSYTAYMARGIALVSEETNPTANGTIVFVYG